MRRARKDANLRGVTPLLDLLFLLLFSLLALSDTRRTTTTEPVRIRLPRVEAGKSGTETRETLVIEIGADSRVRHEGETVAGPAHLDRLLARRLGARLPEEFAVEIHGDAGARHGVGVALLQHLRQRGFAAVSLLALGGEDRNERWDR